MPPDRFYTAVISILALGLGAIAIQVYMVYAHLTTDNIVGLLLAMAPILLLFGACSWETWKIRKAS